jgi:hypothetical protein
VVVVVAPEGVELNMELAGDMRAAEPPVLLPPVRESLPLLGLLPKRLKVPEGETSEESPPRKASGALPILRLGNVAPALSRTPTEEDTERPAAAPEEIGELARGGVGDTVEAERDRGRARPCSRG